MAKRLVKIAKELNVGTTTIVDHLNNKGFDIENKPTAKISDEMYDELLKEFQKSIAIKEKADSLVIGNRVTPSSKDQPKEEPAAPAEPKAETATPPPPPKEEKPVVPVAETTPAKEKEVADKPEKEEAKPEPRKARGLKVLGKINLGKDKPKKEEKAKVEPPKPKVEKKEEPKPEPKPVQPEAEDKKPVEKPVEEKVPEKKEEVPAAKTEDKAEKPSTPEMPEPAVSKPEPEQEKKEEALVKEEKPTPSKPEPPVEQLVETEEKKAKSKLKPEEKKEEKVTAPKSETKPEPQVNKVEEAPEKKKEEAAPEAKAPEEAAKSESKEGESKATAPQGSKLIKANAPELRGLKIQGKIDLNKFERPKKSKKKKEQEKKDEKKGGTPQQAKRKPDASRGGNNNNNNNNNKSGGSSSSAGNDERKKRRRKRKTVSPGGGGGNDRRRDSSRPGGRGQGRGRNQRKPDEPKEVSQKEIEEKIKATMARISGAGKKKRQKMRRDNRERLREKQEIREQEMETGKLQVTEFISVQELANLMDVPVTDVITTCMNLGVIVSINQRLDAEIIELVADEFGHEIEFISVEEQSEEEEEIVDDPEDLKPRAPIVTVMGHVDHGKTSLLDYIREANVASGEAGGITQHIGAYEVHVGEDNKKITFLDTPGHEAFTAMRARGAKVTDIAIIIIAADDSIMPQTKEAISHAQAAGVPIVFAINKVDKPGAQPERIKQELASMNLLVEAWGGQYQSQDISAKTGQGIDELLEKVLLEAEVLELQANPDREAIGAVIEASLDKGRGYVTKMLVQTGTLSIGDATVAGEHSGRVKAMFNERGTRIDKAGPSTPVLVLGLSGAPQAGERFKVVDSDQEARQIATKRMQIAREQANRATKRISLDEIGRRLALGNFKELNLIVKGDVDGSVEALSDSLIKQSIESVQVNVLHKAVGQIVESDVLLASASDAIIIGFQVRPSGGARKLAEREGVQIKMYSIIYEAIEEIRAAIEGMLEPTKEEKITAQVEVRETFKISKVGTVAGCYVTDGKIQRNSKIRLIRNGIVVYPAKEGQVAELASLKRFKDDVREVKSGMECGLNIKNFNDIKVGDVVEAYEIVEIKQTLD